MGKVNTVNIAARTLLVTSLILIGHGKAPATETENLNIRILPVPGPMTVDGRTRDWDLSGGVFVCGDVENLRSTMGLWVHTMYDADRLYVLARWMDETPMSNPGSIAGDYGWNGDSLQLRILIKPQEDQTPTICWVTAWRDRDGEDVIDLDFPNKNHERLKDAKTRGAEQAFFQSVDGRGYVQEISLPWTTLIAGGMTPKPGGHINFSVEANFNTVSRHRITMKDVFRPGVTPDRVFTWTAQKCWGFATFEARGQVTPQALRLADRRRFEVAMDDNVPVINWQGLYEDKEMEGFAPILLDLPEGGFVSLNIKNAEGRVVRQLLTCHFMKRGRHEILWDGLTNRSHLQPGDVVAPGHYHWEAVYHRGLGLRLVGWADNSGATPFDSPGGNWGGDHGMPSAVTTEGQQVFLGWNGSEAGQAVVCTDLDGHVRWRHKHGGFGGANHIAVSGGLVYVHDGFENVIYRLDANEGTYSRWKGRDTAVWPIDPGLAGLDVADGKLYLSQATGLGVRDAETGDALQTLDVTEPGDLEVAGDGSIYVISARTEIWRLKDDGTRDRVVSGLNNARGLAVGSDGAIYVGVLEPDHQIKVFGPDGTLVRTIGRRGGRDLGTWDPNRLYAISGLRVDARGMLWVAEQDDRPKRFSCWNRQDGSFVREFFGPTAYGALGGGMCPDDPLVMVGSGCEWWLNPDTGRARCTGLFHRGNMSNSRFGRGPGGRLYVAVAEGWIHGFNPVSIYERLGSGRYALRTRLEPISTTRNEKGQSTGRITGARIWSDVNNDQQEQPTEVQQYRIDLGGWISGWYMPMTQTMIFYGGVYCIKPTGWTPCGAPLYDLSQAAKMPAPDDVLRRGGMGTQRGCGSQDGQLMLYNGHYGKNHSDFVCYDIPTGKLKWTYPNNYVGVHGGHNAPAPQTGMIRGAYDILGTGRLPDPIGDIFIIGTDKGEWHMLTGEGYYLSRLFEGDPLKIRWPDSVAPGAIMDTCPPGMGSEDFGGSMIITRDGQLHVQAGKTAYINFRVVGLDTVKAIKGGSLEVREEDLAAAHAYREQLLQASVGTRQVTVKRRSVRFTGDLKKDFATSELLTFEKNRVGRIETALAVDEAMLYLGWQVSDDTPWMNGADDPAVMYARGDTVDFQIGTDPNADPERPEAVLGDLRLSIGNFQGQPTAVVYRRIANEKRLRTFFSGVIREGYAMQHVSVLKQARIEVQVDAPKNLYRVEAAIPLESLGLRITPGTQLSGDIGATHGDRAGTDTVLRTYWNNQATGTVADEVFELKMEPRNWGQLVFE